MEHIPMEASAWSQVNTYAAGYLALTEGDIVEAMKLGLLAWLRVVEALREGEIAVTSSEDGLEARLELDEGEGLVLAFRPIEEGD